MVEFDCVIRNGTVATASDVTRCDVGIHDGKVKALADELGQGAREIDASNHWVLPGGIDSHVHIDQVGSAGIRNADDFFTGTRSALCGGTTTIIPFACQHRGESIRQVVKNYHARARGKALIDYAFHMIITDPTEQVLGQELPALLRNGYTSFKIYMTYDGMKLEDRQILEVLALARREGAMVMIHAENDDMISWLTERLLAAGHMAPKFHNEAHSPITEREATHRAVSVAEIVGVSVLIVHVSGQHAMEEIQRAQMRGLKIYAETCPQYLFLSDDLLDESGFEGAKYICSPPPRSKENQEHIWRGIETGVFQVVSSDHAPYRLNDPQGKRIHGTEAPFQKIPNGIPGIEVRLPLLFSAGVNGGRFDINRFVAISSTNHAKLYGLYPRKGTIAVGSDADIAIWDPTHEVTICADMLHDNVDYTPYEGIVVTGWPVTVLSRGEIVYENAKVLADRGRGLFLPCELSKMVSLNGSERRAFDPVTGEYRALD